MTFEFYVYGLKDHEWKGNCDSKCMYENEFQWMLREFTHEVKSDLVIT